jgi:NitT/TauT family transport system substrate-binding protein
MAASVLTKEASMVYGLRIVIVVVACLVPGVAPGQPVTAEKLTLSVGHQPFTPDWTVEIVRMLKLHEKYLPNVQVEWFKALYGPPLVNNMIARKIQLMFVCDTPALVLASKKAALESRLVAVGQTDNGTSAAILVGKDSPIKSVKDLNGKRVATGFGSYLHRFVEVVQAKEGLSFQLLNQTPEVRLSNLEAGKIDADATWPPYWNLAVHKGLARVLTAGDRYGYRTVCSNAVVSKEFADKHPRVVEGWLKAELEAHEFLRKNPDRSAEIIFEAWEKKIPVEVIRKDLAYTTYPDEITPQHIETLKEAAEFLMRQKMIDVKPDVDTFVDDRYLKAARR